MPITLVILPAVVKPLRPFLFVQILLRTMLTIAQTIPNPATVPNTIEAIPKAIHAIESPRPGRRDDDKYEVEDEYEEEDE
jgi:hypothetical protein